MITYLLRLGFAGYVACAVLFISVANSASAESTATISKKAVVAHRGASAYAPENTLEAYRLAIKQDAEYVEQDLQITKDGILVCCHDGAIERVSDVEEVFPDRFVTESVNGEKKKVWYLNDLTLQELKTLDFGSHLKPEFKGVKIPTWQEAIDEIRGKAGLCPELKNYVFYKKRNFDMDKLVMDLLKKNGLDMPGADPKTPVILQSFEKSNLKRLRTEFECKLPMLQLSFANTTWTLEMVKDARTYATGISPYKKDVTKNLVEQAHGLGLTVVPYTFRVGNETPFANVRAEMDHYLYELGVDMLFTDNPDMFPRR